MFCVAGKDTNTIQSENARVVPVWHLGLELNTLLQYFAILTWIYQARVQGPIDMVDSEKNARLSQI